jgi:hypothetical protein
VRVGQRELVLLALGLDEEVHRVHPEPGQAQLRPEAHDPRDLVADLGIRDVEVGLELVELVQVVLLGLLVQLPDAGLLVGEDDALGRVGGLLVGPDVPVALGRVAAAARLHEPRVLVGGVVDHQVRDHAHAAVVGRADQFDDVAERAQPRVDAVEVGDVVAVVLVRRRVEGHQPDARDTQPVQVVDLLDQAAEVAAAVAVAVGVGLDVQAVDDGVLPPQVRRLRQPHAALLNWGRTFSPNAATNASCS